MLHYYCWSEGNLSCHMMLGIHYYDDYDNDYSSPEPPDFIYWNNNTLKHITFLRLDFPCYLMQAGIMLPSVQLINFILDQRGRERYDAASATCNPLLINFSQQLSDLPLLAFIF